MRPGSAGRVGIQHVRAQGAGVHGLNMHKAGVLVCVVNVSQHPGTVSGCAGSQGHERGVERHHRRYLSSLALTSSQ